MANESSSTERKRLMWRLAAIVSSFALLGVAAVTYRDSPLHKNTRGAQQQQQVEEEPSRKLPYSSKDDEEQRSSSSIAWEDEDGEYEGEGAFPRRRLTVENLMDTSTCQPQVEPLVGKKKVLVTGGGGFIGSHVAEALLARGDDVVIVDEMNDYYDPTIKWANIRDLQKTYGTERCKFFQFDFAKFDPMWNIFKKEKIEFVAHIGARAGKNLNVM
jgi:hypothetical protein